MESVAANTEALAQPVDHEVFNQVKLPVAITRLWAMVAGQSHFGGSSQEVGISIRVGRRIFSIVRD